MFQDELKNMLAKRNKATAAGGQPAPPANQNPVQNPGVASKPQQDPPKPQPQMPSHQNKPIPIPVKEDPVKKEDMGSTINQLENILGGGGESKKPAPPPKITEKIVVNKGAPPPPMLKLALPPPNLTVPKPPQNPPNKPKSPSIKPNEEVKKAEPKITAPPPKQEANPHKIFDPIPPPKFETKPVPELIKPEPPKQEEPPKLEIKPPKIESLPTKVEPPKFDQDFSFKIECPPQQEPPRQEPPRQEPPKQEPPRQEPPRQEPPKQEPPKHLDFKDMVKNIRFPTLGLNSQLPKKDKKKLIVCVTHEKGTTKTQEEIVKFLTKNANLAACFGNNFVSGKHRKEREKTEKVEEKRQEAQQAPPQNIPPPPQNIPLPPQNIPPPPPQNIPPPPPLKIPPPPMLNLLPPPPIGGNLGGAPKKKETFDRASFENAKNELKRRMEQKIAEELFEDCIPLRNKIKRLDDLFKNMEAAEGEAKEKVIAELKEEIKKI